MSGSKNCPRCHEVCALNEDEEGFTHCDNCGAEFNEERHEIKSVPEAVATRVREHWLRDENSEHRKAG